VSKHRALAMLKRDVCVAHSLPADAPCWIAQQAVVTENLSTHGARVVYDLLANLCWPENYGQSPFEYTFAAARHIVMGTRPSPADDAPSQTMLQAVIDDLASANPPGEPRS